MRQAPPLGRALHYPATGGTALLAIIGTAACWYWKDFSLLSMNALAWHGEPWRLLTSALPHANTIHLLFNLYWLWVFGTALEEVYGAAKTALLMVALAVVSCAAEYALFAGGVGLSGVGYGLFAYLWVVGKRDRRFEEVVDRQFVFFALAFMGASWGRPLVNVGGREAGQESFQLGYEALRDGRNAMGEQFLAEAVRIFDREPVWWFDLGIARHRRGDRVAAREAYRRAHELEPSNKDYGDALKSVEDR